MQELPSLIGRGKNQGHLVLLAPRCPDRLDKLNPWKNHGVVLSNSLTAQRSSECVFNFSSVSSKRSETGNSIRKLFG